MSDVVERTLKTLPRFVLGGGGGAATARGAQTPRDVQALVQAVHSARSKAEVDAVVQQELRNIQKQLQQPAAGELRGCLLRLLYCVLLDDCDVSFAFIHAVQLAQLGSALDKRIGYLACCLLLHPDHEMTLLLINTIQKDLVSSNMLDNMAALVAASQLVSAENIPAVLPAVLRKLDHQRASVRVKAVRCLAAFWSRAPELVSHCRDQLTSALRDPDPSVLSAAVTALLPQIQAEPGRGAGLLRPLVAVLGQVVARRFPGAFSYSDLPLPWLQVALLRCLAVLAPASPEDAGAVHQLLGEVLQQSNVRSDMALAVTYECLLTACAVQPSQELLTQCSSAITRLLQSRKHNLQYLGITALTHLVQLRPDLASVHRLTVVAWLDHPDSAIQHKALALVYQNANAANVKAVCGQLLERTEKMQDAFRRQLMLARVADLVLRFHPDLDWSLETIMAVLGCYGDAEGSWEVVEAVMALLQRERGQQASWATDSVRLEPHQSALENPDVSPSVLVLSAWVLGECCSPGQGETTAAALLPAVEQHLDRADLPCHAHLHLVAMVTRLLLRGALSPAAVLQWTSHLGKPREKTHLSQRLLELRQLASSSVEDLPRVTVTMATSSLQWDFSLSFLDADVTAAILDPAFPCVPPASLLEEHQTVQGRGELLLPGGGGRELSSSSSSSLPSLSLASLPGTTASTDRSELRLEGVQRVWGSQGPAPLGPAPSAAAEEGPGGEEEERRRLLAEALFQGCDVATPTSLGATPTSLGATPTSPQDYALQEEGRAPPGGGHADLGGWGSSLLPEEQEVTSPLLLAGAESDAGGWHALQASLSPQHPPPPPQDRSSAAAAAAASGSGGLPLVLEGKEDAGRMTASSTSPVPPGLPPASIAGEEPLLSPASPAGTPQPPLSTLLPPSTPQPQHPGAGNSRDVLAEFSPLTAAGPESGLPLLDKMAATREKEGGGGGETEGGAEEGSRGNGEGEGKVGSEGEEVSIYDQYMEDLSDAD